MELAFVPGKFFEAGDEVTGFGTALTPPVVFPTQFACSRASGNICDVQMKAKQAAVDAEASCGSGLQSGYLISENLYIFFCIVMCACLRVS